MAVHPTRIHKSNLTVHQKIALKLADLLGSPYMIYAFVVLACVSLPTVLKSGDVTLIVAWIAQTFIQLVALAILQAKAVLDGVHAEHLANETYKNALRAEQDAEKIIALLTPKPTNGTGDITKIKHA